MTEQARRMGVVAGSAVASTVPQLLEQRVAKTPHAIAFFAQDAGGSWQPITWSRHFESARRLASSLWELGIGRGDRVGILAATSVEWELAQLATLMCSAIAVGIDPLYPDEQLAGVLTEIQPAGLFVGDPEALERIPESIRSSIKHTVSLYAGGSPGQRRVLVLEDLLANAAAGPVADAQARLPSHGDAAVMVFSSGTTGRPKPIVYRHEQVVIAMRTIMEAFPDIAEGSRLACWLPLANLFQRMINFCAMARGAVSYMISDPREVMAHVGVANPHLLIGVPRFYEKVYAGIQERLAGGPPWLSVIARRAVSIGAQRARMQREGISPGSVERLQFAIADRLVLRRLRRIFGRNIRYLVSGSAPMPGWLLEYFDALGLPVFEAYGVSESIVPVAMNHPGQRKLGTVGKPSTGNEVKLAGDGEILVRGPGVFSGYWSASGAMSSARPLGEDLWATGDLGTLDEDGYLRITGRKSDMFKTSTGRWISPSLVEQRLRSIPYVEQAVVTGAGRKAVIALLALQPFMLRSTLESVGGPEPTARLSPEQEGDLRSDIAKALEGLADYQRPSALLITRDAFSISGGELTTNLKLRRKAVEAKYSEQIATVFAAVEQLHPEHGNTGWRHGGLPAIFYK